MTSHASASSSHDASNLQGLVVLPLTLEPGARLTCPTRPFRNPRSRTGQVGDLPREHCGPLSLGQIPTCHEDHSAGEHVDPIGRNCVAIRAATFGKCPSHFATRWAGYFSTQSVAYDARRLSRSRGHRGCRSCCRRNPLPSRTLLSEKRSLSRGGAVAAGRIPPLGPYPLAEWNFNAYTTRRFWESLRASQGGNHPVLVAGWIWLAEGPGDCCRYSEATAFF